MEIHAESLDTISSVGQNEIKFIKPDDIQATFGSDSIGLFHLTMGSISSND